MLLGDDQEAKLDEIEREREEAEPGLEFRRLSLIDEKGRVPADGLEKAKRHMNAMRLAQNAKAASEGKDPEKAEIAGLDPATWFWLGPGNVGGRIRSIVIDPNNPLRLWAGSVSGGIWRSTNAGNTWQPVNDFMANLAVTAMVIDPSNTSNMYAATGEGFGNGDALQGGGIFQSTDSGTTWNLMASTDPAASPVPPPPCNVIGSAPCPTFWQFINRLAMATQPNGSLVILAATNAGIARTIDNGVNWTQVTATAATDVDFDPGNGLNAIAGELTQCPTPPGPPCAASVQRTTDGGISWNAVTFNPQIVNGGTPAANGRVELAYAPSSSNIIYASVNQNQGDVYRSIDSGQNFNQVDDIGAVTNTLGTVGWYANALWVNPRDPNFILVGGVNLYQSGDGGATFALKGDAFTDASVHVDHHVFAVNPTFDDNADKSVYFGNDGGVYRVDDIRNFSRTTGWTERNNSLGITQFYGGAVTPTGVIFGGAQDNGSIRVSPNSSIDPPYDPETWAEIFGSDGGYVAADPTDANYLYAEMQNLGIVRSNDGGATASFIYCASPPSPTTGGPCPSGGITDAFGGSNRTNFIAPFILDPNNANTLLAGGASLWRSVDVKSAANWAAIKAPSAAPISAIAVANGNSDFIVVGHNDGQIFLSQDGTSPNPGWNSITPPVLPAPAPNFARFVTRIAIDTSRSPFWIYATLGGFNNNNVIRTEDLGTTWVDVSGNGLTSLPSVPVRSILINPAVPNTLYVGTEVGIFASDDAGATWELPQGGPANVSVDELFWFAGDIVAATHGRGMYKTHVPVLDTAKCASSDSPSCTNPTPCPTGEVRCSAIGCGCCKAGDWSCPCSWSNGRVPTQNDDVVVACQMAGGGVARNIRVDTELSIASLHAFGDLINTGSITQDPRFGPASILADGDLVNVRPGPAVTTRGVIQVPGTITSGGVLANYGIIAIGDLLTSKGFVSSEGSTVTLARATIEGDIDHEGLLQFNGVFPSQAVITFKSPAGQTSTFSGFGQWRFPNAVVPSLSSFRLGSNVSFAIDNFLNAGTIDVHDHTLGFGGSQFSNSWQNSSPYDHGFLGTGTVAIAPSSGNATFATNSNGNQFLFTPRLNVVSGTVNMGGGSIGALKVNSGATIAVESLDVNGDMEVAGGGSVVPLGTTILNFNGSTLTNNGTIGNINFLNFNRSGSPKTQSIVGVGTWSPINVQLGLYPPSTSTTTLTVQNDVTFNSNGFTISTGSKLDLGSRTFTLAGPTLVTNDGTIDGFFGLLRIQASGTGARFNSIPGAVYGSPIEVSSGLVRTTPGGNGLTFARHLTVKGGATFSMTNPFVSVAGEIQNDGTINTQAGTTVATLQHLGPKFTNNGVITGNGLFVRIGPGVGAPITQLLAGTGSWAGSEQLLVNNTTTLNLLSDITYDGKSFHLLGQVNTGAFTLTLPCTVPWTGTGEAFGNIRRTNLASCSGPIVFGNPFTTIQFTSGTPPVAVTVFASPMVPPGFPAAARRTYFITPSGGSGYTATLRLHYLDSELNGNPESSLELWRNSGTNWTGQGATNRNTVDNWVEYAGVTEFSPWTLSQPAAPIPGGFGFEGDVAGRPTGDGSIQSNDVVQVQRFQIGLDQPAQSNEFQRADSAPLASNGDGDITATDVVQTQRYQIGLDAMQAATGPLESSMFTSYLRSQMVFEMGDVILGRAAGQQRRLRVEGLSAEPGESVTVNIRVDATGDESAYGFRVTYDQAVLTNPSTTIGTAGGSRFCNTMTAGQINCSISNFPNDQPGSSTDQIGEISPGNDQLLLQISFTIAVNALPGFTAVGLTNANSSNDSAASLAIISQNGSVTVLGPTAAQLTISGRVRAPDGRAISQAVLSLQTQNGDVLMTRSSAFGYYMFQGVMAGQTVILTVRHKGYTFQPRVVTVIDEVTSLDIIGEPKHPS
jgi:hypothetical protein